jgi:acyl-coenzyme A synthetase/AMP-(fatty) acid ligase
VPGFNIHILHTDGTECEADEEGAVAIKLPLPPACLPTLWEDEPGFRHAYLSQFPGYYFTGDGGFRDPDGYLYITGRIDDVINVAGHRLSTAEMEEIVSAHPAVAECAVIGIAEELKGQVPVGFVVLKAGVTISDEQIEHDLIASVRNTIGAVASFRRAVVVKRLPKTRSGKILRKIMRAIADGKPFNTPSTIEDPDVLQEIAEAMKAGGVGEAFTATTA